MKDLRDTLLATGLLGVLALSSCSSSTGNEAGVDGGDLYITSCSLACTNGTGGTQVFCSIINTAQNQEVSVLFSERVELFSVNSSSFRVVDVSNGTTPIGQFFLDPLNAKRLIFRPALTFDQNGNPLFGFEDNTAYQITIPGQAQGDNPPFITSVKGRVNQSRMQCTILTSEPLVDPVPGPPSVELRVTVVTSYDVNGNPNGFAFDQPVTEVPQVVDVFRDSDIRFVFADIMNPATLANPQTGTSPFIRVLIDEDGVVTTTGDRTVLTGFYTVEIDLERLETILVFEPDLPFPSAGPLAPASPRRIVVTMPETVLDLVGNKLLAANGGGTQAFVPEIVLFGQLELPKPGGEDFILSFPAPGSGEDGTRSGSVWGSGRLAHGFGGGSGRLGDLFIPTGTQITLNTDSQTFPLTTADGAQQNLVADLIGNKDMMGEYPVEITVTDGVFEFNSIQIEVGGALRLEGINPARVYSRGPVFIAAGGVINVSGITPETHNSQLVERPEQELMTPVNAPNGGDGGFGGDRIDMGQNAALLGAGQFLGPTNDAVDVAGNNANGSGRNGMGTGRIATLGGGIGGRVYPNNFPLQNQSTLPNNNNNHEIVFNVTAPADYQFTLACTSMMVGSTGGGGAYSTDGTAGTSTSPAGAIPDAIHPDQPQTLTNEGPDTPGGSSADLGLATPNINNSMYVWRLLEYQTGPGYLRGGSGGGGGGAHPFLSRANGPVNPPSECLGLASLFTEWHDHSGARGGFGGGAIYLVSGKRIEVEGTIDASGGEGGTALQTNTVGDFGKFAMPGGGGSGGAIKLQSIEIVFGPGPGRLDVSGGAGGAGFWSESRGGDGGAGLVRIEDILGNITHSSVRPSVAPFDANAPDSLDWLSVAAAGWSIPNRDRPNSITASSSCWIRPEGNFLVLNFQSDSGPLPTDQGWNMDVFWKPSPSAAEVLIPFRGVPQNNPDFPFNNSFEDEFGTIFGQDLQPGDTAAPLVVRFQGARVTADPEDSCNVDLNDFSGSIVPGSVTGWVEHPAELNAFEPIPNMIRYVVIFDGTVDVPNNDVPGLILFPNIKGVTNFRIIANPE